MLLQTLTQVGLLLCQPYIIILVCIMGYLFINERRFAQAMMLILFTMVYNTVLKAYWQIPLPVSSGTESWAFPSGHMHGAVVFWGWLAYASRNWPYRLLTALGLGLTGYSIVAHGYHYPLDVIGATCFGIVTMTGLHLAQCFTAKNSFLGLGFSVLAIGLLTMMPAPIQPHQWIGFGALLGFSIGIGLSELNRSERLHTQVPVRFVLLRGILLLGLTFSGVYLLNVPAITALPIMGRLLGWILLGLFLGGGKRLLSVPHGLNPSLR